MDQKKYNFDEVIDRVGTHCLKFDRLPEGAPADALPLWVADMDFPCADPILDALHARIDRKIFGYTTYDNEEGKAAVCGWFKKRFDWSVDADDIFFSPGVVPAIAYLINALTEEGDGVVIQRPVYYPFTIKIEANGRRVVNNSLIYEDGAYRMDYEDLEMKMSDPLNKGMILCSPHNPAGRVWKEEELKKLVEICQKYDKWIISDEIHFDLTRIGVVHHPLLKIAPEYKDRIIVCTAPSKTFNLAGMHTSNLVISNPEYKKLWMRVANERFSASDCNPFGLTAEIAAYNDGENWLEQVREYLDRNIDYVREFVKQNLPKAKMVEAEGTYLVWIDFNGYEKDPKKLEELMQKKAKVALDEGYIFGEEGAGFERINVACARSVLVDCMERIKAALDN
ncbi:MAG: pyridoxal phosphate-dependent aminotransferase [Clostridiaceae bacterium]|nr:pyridoxal phosphate-dependent aminotransferase [Clostridiaceae bacterium]